MDFYASELYHSLKDFFSERDFLDSEEAGLPIAMRRNRMKAWCGYVGVPSTHPLFEKEYSHRIAVPNRGATPVAQASPIGIFVEAAHEDDGKVALDILLRAPGGITYSGKTWPRDNDHWWFGFDCNHIYDLTPWDIIQAHYTGRYLHAEATYKTFSFVEDATRALARQLAEFTHA